MLNRKQQIIENFNQSARTYHTAATVQAHVAEQLAKQCATLRPPTLLEIGCGTGLLSQHLIRLFPETRLVMTDAAPAMVAQCRAATEPHQSIDFICMDGEQLALKNRYDLILSSMTLHWFSNLEKSILEITQQLQPGGQFIFSLLNANSFKEWHAMCRHFNLPIATPLFPTMQSLKTLLPTLQLKVETYQQTYENAYAFLHSLKKIGATVSRADYVPLSLGELRRLLRHFNTKLTISYEIIYGSYRKE